MMLFDANEFCGSRTWDFVKSYCEECCKMKILVVQGYMQSGVCLFLPPV